MSAAVVNQTILRPNELIMSVRIPLPSPNSQTLGSWDLGSWEWLGVGPRELGVELYRGCAVRPPSPPRRRSRSPGSTRRRLNYYRSCRWRTTKSRSRRRPRRSSSPSIRSGMALVLRRGAVLACSPVHRRRARARSAAGEGRRLRRRRRRCSRHRRSRRVIGTDTRTASSSTASTDRTAASRRRRTTPERRTPSPP